MSLIPVLLKDSPQPFLKALQEKRQIKNTKLDKG
jgi:hypothetical protein